MHPDPNFLRLELNQMTDAMKEMSRQIGAVAEEVKGLKQAANPPLGEPTPASGQGRAWTAERKAAHSMKMKVLHHQKKARQQSEEKNVATPTSQSVQCTPVRQAEIEPRPPEPRPKQVWTAEMRQAAAQRARKRLQAKRSASQGQWVNGTYIDTVPSMARETTSYAEGGVTITVCPPGYARGVCPQHYVMPKGVL